MEMGNGMGKPHIRSRLAILGDIERCEMRIKYLEISLRSEERSGNEKNAQSIRNHIESIRHELVAHKEYLDRYYGDKINTTMTEGRKI